MTGEIFTLPVFIINLFIGIRRYIENIINNEKTKYTKNTEKLHNFKLNIVYTSQIENVN